MFKEGYTRPTFVFKVTEWYQAPEMNGGPGRWSRPRFFWGPVRLVTSLKNNETLGEGSPEEY